MEFTPLHLSSYRKLLLAKIIPLSKIWWKYTETRTKLSYMHHRDPPPRIFIAIFPVIVWLDQRSQWKNYIGLGDGANVVANPVHHRVEAPLSNWSRLDLRVATIDRSELGEGSPSLRPRRDRREGGREEKKKKREIYACRARKTRRFVLAARGGDSSSSARWLSARRSGNAGRGGSTGDRDVIARSGTTARILVSRISITFELHFFSFFPRSLLLIIDRFYC